MIKLNQNPIIELDYCNPRPFASPTIEYSWNYKHYELKKVYDELHPFCQTILDKMIGYIKSPKKYQYVFIKAEILRKGQQISNGLWHLDSQLNGGDFENFIYICDSNSPTEFIKTPLEIKTAKDANDFNKKILAHKFDILQIKPRTIYKYDGYNIHRGPKAIQNENRILIRLQNTDYQMKPHKVYHIGRLT